MMAQRLYEACEQTWRPRATTPVGPFILRDGDGGGKRVSAATVTGPYNDADLDRIETAMSDLGQPHLFMIKDGDDAFDANLAARGYQIIDPVNLLIGNCADLAHNTPDAEAIYTAWPPLAAQCEIWETDDIGPARIRVMDRVRGPKTSIMIRHQDRPAGTGFVALHDGIAMLHGLVVAHWARRQGLANQIMAAAAIWAQDMGVDRLSVLVVKTNAPANALYASLGMENVGTYHYRIK